MEERSSQEDGTSTPVKTAGQKEFCLVSHVNARTSIVFMIFKLILLDILATATALGFFGVFSYSSLPEWIRAVLISSNVAYFLTLAIVKITFSLYVVFQWLNEYYEIMPNKVIYRRGIIWRRVDVYDFAHIRSLGIQQGFLGRIFNYGSLSIYDRGVYKYYFLNYIHNPTRYFKLLQTLCPEADIEKEVIREHVRDEETKA